MEGRYIIMTPFWEMADKAVRTLSKTLTNEASHGAIGWWEPSFICVNMVKNTYYLFVHHKESTAQLHNDLNFFLHTGYKVVTLSKIKKLIREGNKC